MSELTISTGSEISFISKQDIFFCDPCYVFDHHIEELDKAWDRMCSLMFDDEKNEGKLEKCGIINFKGAKILYGGTKHGDGYYGVRSNLKMIGSNCGVDAGLLAVMSCEDVLKINPEFFSDKSNTSLGVLIPNYSGTIRVVDCDWFGDEGFFCATSYDDEEEDYNDEEDYGDGGY